LSIVSRTDQFERLFKTYVYNYNGSYFIKETKPESGKSDISLTKEFHQIAEESLIATIQELYENISEKISNKGEISAEKDIPTRFSDVLGIDEFKEELEEIVDYLRFPEKYKEHGAIIPKGVLLAGPPGTGKTLMARALAGEAGCNFFYKSGSEFEEIFVGVGSKRVRELFDKARKNTPSIIFIDEIDALAGERNPMQSSVMRGTINQILSEMDGFKTSDNIIVIGATNMEGSIDKAILRPGRFDKVINIGHPDKEGRKKIIEYYLNKIQFDETVSSDRLARACFGFTGADIKNLIN
jgi:ATP-dependent metalloprotease